jgi:hypothetical protein
MLIAQIMIAQIRSGIKPPMKNLEDLLSCIQTDYAFYVLFKKRPQEALSCYGLSAEERAILAESGAQLSAHLERPGFPLSQSTHHVALGSDYREFNTAATLSRPAVWQAVVQIRDASMATNRLAAVLALMEQIG